MTPRTTTHPLGAGAAFSFRAERKAGEMLREAKAAGTVESKGGDRGNRYSSKVDSDDFAKPATLSEIGITKDESSRYQKLANMPDEHFETAIETAKQAAGVKNQVEGNDLISKPATLSEIGITAAIRCPLQRKLTALGASSGARQQRGRVLPAGIPQDFAI